MMKKLFYLLAGFIVFSACSKDSGDDIPVKKCYPVMVTSIQINGDITISDTTRYVYDDQNRVVKTNLKSFGDGGYDFVYSDDLLTEIVLNIKDWPIDLKFLFHYDAGKLIVIQQNQINADGFWVPNGTDSLFYNGSNYPFKSIRRDEDDVTTSALTYNSSGDLINSKSKTVGLHPETSEVSFTYDNNHPYYLWCIPGFTFANFKKCPLVITSKSTKDGIVLEENVTYTYEFNADGYPESIMMKVMDREKGITTEWTSSVKVTYKE